jgi:hypothetical protein
MYNVPIDVRKVKDVVSFSFRIQNVSVCCAGPQSEERAAGCGVSQHALVVLSDLSDLLARLVHQESLLDLSGTMKAGLEDEEH